MLKIKPIAALGFLFLSSQTFAAAELIPIGDNPGGQTASLSVQQWAEWASSFDRVVDGGDPISDDTGEFQNKKQTYPLFFLGGAASEGFTRSFTAQAGKPLAIPFFNITCASTSGFDCTDPGVVEFVEGFLDDADSLFLSLDGTVLVDASTAEEVDLIEDQFRVVSDLFDLTIAPNNWLSEPEGVWPNSFSAGFYAFVAELPLGEHEIIFGGSTSGFANSVEATITVVPAPATLFFLLGGLGFIMIRSSRLQAR